MKTVSLRLNEIRYLQDAVRYDLAKTQDEAEKDRLRGLFVKLQTAMEACFCGASSYLFTDPNGRLYCNLHKPAGAEAVSA